MYVFSATSYSSIAFPTCSRCASRGRREEGPKSSPSAPTGHSASSPGVWPIVPGGACLAAAPVAPRIGAPQPVILPSSLHRPCSSRHVGSVQRPSPAPQGRPRIRGPTAKAHLPGRQRWDRRQRSRGEVKLCPPFPLIVVACPLCLVHVARGWPLCQ